MATKSLHYRRVFGIYFNRAPTHTSNDKGERVFFLSGSNAEKRQNSGFFKGQCKIPGPRDQSIW